MIYKILYKNINKETIIVFFSSFIICNRTKIILNMYKCTLEIKVDCILYL